MMKKIVFLILLVGCGFLLKSCNKDDFPVPPASTVPLFTYTVSNEEFAPATVAFTNTSIVPSNVGTATFSWNFGDGSSSSENNPTHVYEEPGVFKINLVVATSTSLEIRELSQTIVIKDPAATGVPIYFTDGTQLKQGLINSQAPIFTPVNGIATQSSYGMVIDTLNQKLYISDADGNKIFKSDLDGSNVEDFRSGLDAPIGMAIDYAEKRLYWSTGTGVQYADMNSTDVNQKVDFVTGQTNDPEGVSIDLTNRKLYWVNYDGGVGVKNLDGTGESMMLPDVDGGSIVVINNRIYFDDYIASGDIRLKSAALDGSGVTTIAVGIGRLVYGMAYDPKGQKIYWGDRTTDVMMRANLDGSNPEAWFASTGDTRGIVIGKQQ